MSELNSARRAYERAVAELAQVMRWEPVQAAEHFVANFEARLENKVFENAHDLAHRVYEAALQFLHARDGHKSSPHYYL